MRVLWADRVVRVTVYAATTITGAAVLCVGLSAHTFGLIPVLGFAVFWHARPEPTLEDELEQLRVAFR